MVAATGLDPTRLPLGVAVVRTGRPFQVTWLAELNTSKLRSVPLSPVSASCRPPALLAAVRSRCVPRTSTGPAAVSWRQNVSAVGLSASNSSSGRCPDAATVTRISPACR